MSIAGVSIILILGIINLLLALFQLSSGMHWIKVPIKVHKSTGIALVIGAVVHGALAILVS